MAAADPNQPPGNLWKVSVQRYLLVPIFIVVLSACEPCDERIEEALFSYEWATKSQAEKRLGTLRSIVASCPIPESGVPNRFAGNTHPAEIYFVVGEFEKAAEALKSEQVEMTERQEFDLVSYAANHKNPEVLDLVLASGVDPTISEPDSGVTTIMHASQSAFSPVERMKRLASLGVNPLAVGRDGFSALDFAIAEGEEEAVEQVLNWVEAGLPESEQLILFSIDVAERSYNQTRAQQLRDWLATRTATISE